MSEEEEISQNDENENQIKNINKNRNKRYNNNKMIDSSNSLGDSNDIMSKINQKAKKVKTKVNSKNLNVFEKYHNLSIKELHILLSQKNDDLIKLNEEKEKSKKILHDLFSKLNNTITNNSEYLYDDETDDELIYNLGKIKEDKKKQLENSKKINNLFKEQLSNIKDKLSSSEKEKKKLSLIDKKIDNLKKKNILLKKEINEIKNKKVIQDKELEIISENIKYPLKIKIKTEEMSNFASQKHDYFSKFSMSLKSLDNVLKEIKRFDEMYNSSIKEDTDENIVKKINFWMNLIKNDLSGDKNDIVARVENGKSQFLNEIKNRNEICSTNGYDTNMTNSISKAHTEESPQKINEAENDDYKINGKNVNSKIIINKNKSSSLLFSNFKNSANIMKRNQIPSIYNKSNNSGNYTEHKTLFKKLNYLKAKSPNNIAYNGMKIKLKNINNKDKNYRSSNNYISEEINDSVEMNNNIDYTQPNQNQVDNQELNTILTRDFNEITDAEYRELLNKKEQYLESNMRLEKNIIDIQKTKNKKLSNIVKVIKENGINLENIKKQNNLIEKEINNLCNVFKLTIEQAKLQNEIKQNNNRKKIKLKKESVKNENEENKLYTSVDNIQKNKNFDDIEIPKKRKIKSIEISNSSSKKKKKKNETREEKLKMIREKYKNGIDEINEDNQIDNDNNNTSNNDIENKEKKDNDNNENKDNNNNDNENYDNKNSDIDNQG